MRPNQATFKNVKVGDKLILVDNSIIDDCDFYVKYNIGDLFEVLSIPYPPTSNIIYIKEKFGSFNIYNIRFIERFDIYNPESAKVINNVGLKNCSTCSYCSLLFQKCNKTGKAIPDLKSQCSEFEKA